MNTKVLSGFLVGAMALAASIGAPAEARNHNNWQQQMQQIALQQQLLRNQQYGAYGAYGYGQQVGAYGLNPNDPNYFRQAQQRQWQESQGQGQFANTNFHNTFNNGFTGHNSNGLNSFNGLNGYAGYLNGLGAYASNGYSGYNNAGYSNNNGFGGSCH